MTLPLNKRIVLEWGGVPFLGHSFPFRCLFSPAGCRASVDAEGNGPSPVWLGGRNWRGIRWIPFFVACVRQAGSFSRGLICCRRTYRGFGQSGQAIRIDRHNMGFLFVDELLREARNVSSMSGDKFRCELWKRPFRAARISGSSPSRRPS